MLMDKRQLDGLRILIPEEVPEETRGIITAAIGALKEEKDIGLLVDMKAVIGLPKGNEFYLYLFEDRDTALAAMKNYMGDLKSLGEECEKCATRRRWYPAEGAPIICMDDGLLKEIEKYTQKPF